MSTCAKRCPRLLVINCTRDLRGLFVHTIYDGRLELTNFGISDLCADSYWLNMMRMNPEEFLKQFCVEDEK